MQQPKATPQLDADRFELAEYQRNTWTMNIEAGITRAQVLNPAFLAHVATKLRPYDKIEIRSDDGTLYAEAIVLQSERTWARIHIVAWHDLTTKDVSLSATDVEAQKQITEAAREQFRVEWKGPQKKFCVIRSQDGAYIREGDANKEDANAWLESHIKTVAA